VADRALFVRRGALGDTLLLAAVLRAWRRTLPAGTELVLAGVHDHVALLQHAGLADRAVSSEDFAAWSPGRLRAQLAGYRFVVADDPAFVAVGPSGARNYDPRPRGDEPLPVQLAAQLGLRLDWPADQRLVLPATAATTVLASTAERVVLAPGSGAAAKCWPGPRWLELAARLHAQGWPLAVLVGPVERDRDDPRRWAWPVPVGFAEPADAIALAHGLAAACAFVGNDSGPAHLAAMLGITTVALFGPSEARVFGPIGPAVHLLQAPHDDLDQLDVDPVARLVGTVVGR
jgi:heptosyltransferase-3